MMYNLSTFSWYNNLFVHIAFFLLSNSFDIIKIIKIEEKQPLKFEYLSR